MAETSYVVYAAAYNSVDEAVADFATLKEAGLRHVTAAVVVKDDQVASMFTRPTPAR
jgi:hypothetical protein